MTKKKELFLHQKAFLEKNPNKGLLVHDTGLGKTVTAIEWLKLRPSRKALVIAPRAIQNKWRKELREWGGTSDVITTDEIKKHNLSPYKAIVIDECHMFAAALFDKSRSQRATVLYNFLKNNPNTHILLMSATPIRSSSYNLHTLSCYLGQYIPIKKWRDEYFFLSDLYGRYHYEPVKDWRTKVRKPLEELADIVLLSQVRDVPVQTHTVIEIKMPKYKSTEYFEPAKEWHARHRYEQGEEKWEELKKLIDGYQKIIIVAYYREQIADYEKRLAGERELFVLTGSTRDPEAVISAAQASPDCVLIVQSGLGVGFDADSFSVMVFASQGFSYVSLVQMCGRINRIHNLHKNIYYYLHAGPCDRAVYKAMETHADFDPMAYMQNETT